jgi:hypothetical protein
MVGLTGLLCFPCFTTIPVANVYTARWQSHRQQMDAREKKVTITALLLSFDAPLHRLQIHRKRRGERFLGSDITTKASLLVSLPHMWARKKLRSYSCRLLLLMTGMVFNETLARETID